MKRELRIPDYLEHMRDAIAKILRYIQGMDWETFATDSLTQDATIRNFEVLGEVARDILRADPKFTERYPDFPLGNAIGMRNTLAHGYLDVKLDVVWKTAREDLPGLALKVSQILTALNAQYGGESP
jgi:uncharacterized protein with HEPN domain